MGARNPEMLESVFEMATLKEIDDDSILFES